MVRPRKVQIRVPCTSSNIGPGFDVLGLSLSMYLTLHVEIRSPRADRADGNHNADLVLKYEGEGASPIPTDAERNLITKTALYVLMCHGTPALPAPLVIRVDNRIPMGRGLGSSGAAVVAGVLLANAVGDLGLSRDRMLDFCLMIEQHPDNVTAALIGGFVASYLRELDPNTEPTVIPRSETLETESQTLGQLPPSTVPSGIGHYVRLGWAPEIKAVTVIPQFEVATAAARDALPAAYKRDHVVFNLQRVAVLISAIAQSPPDPNLIFQAMQDKVHQPYRQELIPGLSHILSSVRPSTHPGLLGICLSGAGPTILALATDNFKNIADTIKAAFKEENVEAVVEVLDVTHEGAQTIDLE